MRLFVTAILTASLCLTGWNSTFAADDLLIADFESTTYGDWQVTGTAFGDGPVGGAINGQMSVTGFKGKGLVNSFHGGDQATGTLTSPEFSIARPFINMLIGGGGYAGETEVQLRVGDEIVRTATGPNTQPGGSEELTEYSWDVAALIGQNARIRIVDHRTGGWGHINVDDIRQSDQRSAPELLKLEKELLVDDRYLLVPVSNYSRRQNVVRLNLYSGEELVQNFNVSLPLEGDAYWLAAYPLSPFGVDGKRLTIRPATAAMSTTAIQTSFERIRIGSQDEAWAGDDYEQPYRNQFHISTRRGWNNDPNGMVYHDGKYHLYYQYNPFGIFWGNMHWGHFISDDMIHWKEKPIALFQKTERDMMFSGGGFVDHDNTAGYGENTLFIAFTSTGRGECLAYSTDGGQTFTEIPENPVVQHRGRDPKIIWYAPQQKWVMVVYDEDESELTKSTPFNENMKHHKNANLAFYESKDLHTWTLTGAFTDYDRESVFECPEFFELPIEGQPGESRWCLMAATNRYFIGTFDGNVFQKESGPHGQRRGAFYAPQTFSDTPDGRRIQMGWIQPASFEQQVPDQISNQAFSLPHQMTLRRTAEGLRLFCTPVKEVDTLRAETLASGSDLDAQAAEKLLQACGNELKEVVIELSVPAKLQLRINGIDATFEGGSARIYNDRTVNEVYVDQGREYRINARDAKQLGDKTTTLQASDDVKIQSLKVYRLKSIF